MLISPLPGPGGSGHLELSVFRASLELILSPEILLQQCNHSLPAQSCCSVAKSCLTLCNPMDCRVPGSPVLHCLLEFVQIHVHRLGDTIQPSHPLPPPFPPAFNLSFPASGAFPMSQLFTSGSRSTGASASASVFPMNIQLSCINSDI